MFRMTIGAAALALLAACGNSTPSEPAAAEVTADPSSLFVVSDAYVRQPLIGRDVTAAYLTLTSEAETPAQVIAVSSTHSISVEMHSHAMEDGLMRMRKVDTLSVPSNGSLVLEPMSDHLMLFGIEEGLVEGDIVTIVMTVTVDGQVQELTFDAPIRAIN